MVLELFIGITMLVFLMILVLIALAIGVFVFWIVMLVDCATRKFKNDTDKIVWILVIVFTGIIGALIYYFIVKKDNKH